MVIGIGIIIAGIFISIDMRNKTVEMGRNLCVLELETEDDWSDIPGTRRRDLNHQYQIFLPAFGNNTTPDDVKYGAKPVSQMFGSYTFNEERIGDNITVTEDTDFSNYTGILFNYTDEIKFYQTSLPNNTKMNDTYTVYNYEAFSVLYSHRMEEDWMRAIRALSTMINYTSVQVRNHLVLNQLRKDFFENVYSTEDLFDRKRLDVFRPYSDIDEATYHEMWIDEIYGFKDFNNTLVWGAI